MFIIVNELAFVTQFMSHTCQHGLTIAQVKIKLTNDIYIYKLNYNLGS